MTAASLYYHGLRALGVTAATRSWRGAGVILCYHNVVPDGPRGFGDDALHITCDRFERQMRWLAGHYDVISLREFVLRVESGADLQSTAAVTFDDGYGGVFEHAVPRLRALRLPATVFVVTEAVGRAEGFWWDHPDIALSATPERREQWLHDLQGDAAAIMDERRVAADPHPAHRPANWTTIRSHLGEGVELGVHSATHRSLPSLTDRELHFEIVASRATVERETGARPDFFAYPYGRWNRRVSDVVRRAGYRAAMTLDSGLNRRDTHLWALRRVNVPAGISDVAFEAWAAGLQRPRMPCASRI